VISGSEGEVPFGGSPTLPYIVFANKKWPGFPEEEPDGAKTVIRGASDCAVPLGCDRGFRSGKREFTRPGFFSVFWIPDSVGQAVSARPDPPGEIDGLRH